MRNVLERLFPTAFPATTQNDHLPETDRHALTAAKSRSLPVCPTRTPLRANPKDFSVPRTWFTKRVRAATRTLALINDPTAPGSSHRFDAVATAPSRRGSAAPRHAPRSNATACTPPK